MEYGQEEGLCKTSLFLGCQPLFPINCMCELSSHALTQEAPLSSNLVLCRASFASGGYWLCHSFHSLPHSLQRAVLIF